MQRKTRAVFVGLLFILLVVILTGTALIGQGKIASPANGFPREKSSSITKNQEDVAALEAAVAANPEDTAARLKLADAYFNLGLQEKATMPEQAVRHFRQAAGAYQEAVKRRDSVQATVNLAVAAFYGKDDDLAEQVFKAAVIKYPYTFDVHFNYGIFLYHAKQDYSASIEEWQRALELKPSGPQADQLHKLIAGLQTQIREGQVKQP